MIRFPHRGKRLVPVKVRLVGPARAGLLAALVCLWGGGPVLAGQESAPGELRTAEQVRRLSPEEAERHYPVRLRGTITFFDQRIPTAAFRFIQDDTAGIYFFPAVDRRGTAGWRRASWWRSRG